MTAERRKGEKRARNRNFRRKVRQADREAHKNWRKVKGFLLSEGDNSDEEVNRWY